MSGAPTQRPERPRLPVVGHAVAILGAVLSGISMLNMVVAAATLGQDLSANSGLSELCRLRPGFELYLWFRVLLLLGIDVALLTGCLGVLAQKTWSRRLALISAAALVAFGVVDPLIMIPAYAPLSPFPMDDLWLNPLVRVAAFELSLRLFVSLCLWAVLRDPTVRRALAAKSAA
jgi:hypothetical protein